ncbi:MAG TPA: DUF5615 family PIN-like protein [Acidimicrobiia bacterium]|nr:DUF5615 family PIN-like protein [Acidimicrobiia bacterium]
MQPPRKPSSASARFSPGEPLLDVHHSPQVARRLRDQGHDVVAASEDPVLAALDDEELLRAATRERRAVVTENARDFDRIVRDWSARGEHHAGVVFTSARRFHRGSKAYPANLARALATFLGEQEPHGADWVHWIR